jgi:hypothetical protein
MNLAPAQQASAIETGAMDASRLSLASNLFR